MNFQEATADLSCSAKQCELLCLGAQKLLKAVKLFKREREKNKILLTSLFKES